MYTKEELLKRRAQLSAKQQNLLDQQIRGEHHLPPAAAYAAIPKRPADAPIPLAYPQERLWFLQQLDPDKAVCNQFWVRRLRGRLKLEALNQMARELYRRHEILRTRFLIVDGIPQQCIDPTMHTTYHIPLTDLTNFPNLEQLAEVQQRAVIASEKPFDLGSGCLLRLELLRLAHDDHVLFITLHHIIYDEWSNQILLDEIKALYEAFHHDKPSPLPELPIQYADFAYWQRQWLTADILNKQLDYWATQFATTVPFLELPTDYARQNTQHFESGNETLSIEPKLANALQITSQTEGVTLFMLMLAAFKTLLFYHTNQTDLIVGTLIAGRNNPEVEKLIGFFLNLLPLRSDLSGDPSFTDLLQQVRKGTLDAYNNQDVPFEKMIEVFRPRRDPTRTPVYQSMFVLQNVPQSTKELPASVTLEDWPLAESEDSLDPGAQCDITLMFYEQPNGSLRGVLLYDKTLFLAETIQRMLTQYHTLLQSIVTNPKARLSQLQLATEHEQTQILHAWNPPTELIEKLPCIPQQITLQAVQNPDATAIIDRESRLSYAELEQQANQLANLLIEHGAGPMTTIGVLLERSSQLIVTLLAILKTGAAYVPLDVLAPESRLLLIAQKASLTLLVSTTNQKSILETHVPVLYLDSAAMAIATAATSAPTIEIYPQSLAYCIYTSGSTGEPKGVGIPHIAFSNFVASTIKEYSLSSEDKVLQFATVAFDASIEEIFPTLVCGATLVLRNDELVADPQTFIPVYAQSGITVLNLPTAYWHMLETPNALPAPIRLVIIGGEAAQPERWRHWQTILSSTQRLINTYGPTEATVVATRFEGAIQSQRVPIGQPISNTQAYVLNAGFNIQPIGVAGEIFLGGIDLAREYINNPLLTARCFVPNPFNAIPGSRLYRTGDRGRYRSDGAIEYLGRFDDQVKIRGFRVELGEIERTLAAWEEIAMCAVTIHQVADASQLVCYVTTNAMLNNTLILNYLKARLPEYMLPNQIIILDTFPLTSNGKIDRRGLPIPAFDNRTSTDAAFVEPNTAIEIAVADIWATVLKRDRLGIHDNFFALGGHSLLITQVIYRVNQAFDTNLPLRSLFDQPTIAELALHVEEALLDAIEDLDDDEAWERINPV